MMLGRLEILPILGSAAAAFLARPIGKTASIKALQRLWRRYFQFSICHTECTVVSESEVS